MCDSWISSEQFFSSSFLTTRMYWRVLKMRPARRRFHWETCISPVKLYFYTQYCWILSVAFSSLRSYCLTCYFFLSALCRIHVHRYNTIKNPDESCFTQNSACLEMYVFCCCVFCVTNKILVPDVWIIITWQRLQALI